MALVMGYHLHLLVRTRMYSLKYNYQVVDSLKNTCPIMIFFNYYNLILIFSTSYYIVINNRLMSIKGAGFLRTVLQLCHYNK